MMRSYTLNDLLEEILSLQKTTPEAMDIPLQYEDRDGAEDIKYVAFGIYDQDGESHDGIIEWFDDGINVQGCRVIMHVCRD